MKVIDETSINPSDVDHAGDDLSPNRVDASVLSASEQVGNATYATVGDVPTTLPEGAQVYVQDEDRIYVEDGT